ncbi:hypothetical protein MMC20_004782 [Loxospora ochrophaea]|nr:hypothetical protein [Loxospora ochrophaea]
MQGRMAYESLLSGPPPPPFTYYQPTFTPEQSKKKQRAVSAGEPLAPGERIIQPRPSAFAPVNLNGPDQLVPGSGDKRTGKKRGRPSKAEFELRVAEAAARGEVYPPPKRVKAPRQTQEGGTGGGGLGESGSGGGMPVEGQPGGAPLAVMWTLNTTGSEAAGSAPESIRQQDPEQGQDTVRRTSLEATASAAQQMQPSGAPSMEGTTPETQSSSHAAPDRFIAQMRQHAEAGGRQDVPMSEAPASPRGGERPVDRSGEASQPSATTQEPTTTTPGALA